MNWIVENYVSVLLLLAGVLELALRYIPTARNYSIIDTVIKVIRFFIPNKRVEVAPDGKKKVFKKGFMRTMLARADLHM